jgi:NOL1/NOP2/fmu family ribosome biogenesis protein
MEKHYIGNMKMEKNNFKHTPIMLNECIDGLNIKPNGIYVATYLNANLGGGKIINGTLKNYYPKDLRT